MDALGVKVGGGDGGGGVTVGADCINRAGSSFANGFNSTSINFSRSRRWRNKAVGNGSSSKIEEDVDAVEDGIDAVAGVSFVG